MMTMAMMCWLQQQERDDSNLYIANLPLQTSEKDLEVMFLMFGSVVSTRILRSPSGISRGVGFVRMESKHVCEAIIDAFNNKLMPGIIDFVSVVRLCQHLANSWDPVSLLHL